jgi:hypothetical protein
MAYGLDLRGRLIFIVWITCFFMTGVGVYTENNALMYGFGAATFIPLGVWFVYIIIRYIVRGPGK